MARPNLTPQCSGVLWVLKPLSPACSRFQGSKAWFLSLKAIVSVAPDQVAPRHKCCVRTLSRPIVLLGSEASDDEAQAS